LGSVPAELQLRKRKKVIEERNVTTATPHTPAQGRRQRTLVSKESIYTNIIYNELRTTQSKEPAPTSLLDWETLSSWGDEAIKELAIM
jgi:hypothetical protein